MADALGQFGALITAVWGVSLHQEVGLPGAGPHISAGNPDWVKAWAPALGPQSLLALSKLTHPDCSMEENLTSAGCAKLEAKTPKQPDAWRWGFLFCCVVFFSMLLLLFYFEGEKEMTKLFAGF